MILYLHDILDTPDPLDLLTGRISTHDFDKLITLLQAPEWNWLGFEEYCSRLKKERLEASDVCLSFDDASVTLATHALEKLTSLGKDCAFMIPSAPYMGSHIHFLPHQYVEGVFRLEKRDISQYRPLKKLLKKKARVEGVQAYWDWLASIKIKLHELEDFMSAFERFSFMLLKTLHSASNFHSLIYHGHFHLPLGDQSVAEVFEDQFLGRHFMGHELSCYALPYGDLVGHLREELKQQYEWIFGTEGPYVDEQVVIRYDAREFLARHAP